MILNFLTKLCGYDKAGSDESKAEIIRIGIIDENDEPQGWTFHCEAPIPAIEVKANGEILYGGYSVDELRLLAIHATD